MIAKEGYWELHELKPRGDVVGCFFACEQLVERQTRKGFLHRIVTGDEKWVNYNSSNPNRSAENHGDCPVITLLRQNLGRMNIHGSKVMLCVWWGDQLGVIYYELLKPSETITDVAAFDLTHLFRSMAHGLTEQHLSSYEEVKNWIDSWILSKDEIFSPRDWSAAREKGQSGS
nr:transposase [Hymenolepis microstoma]CUU99295.1 transposase [Hymenolepis microstoma]